MLAGLGLVTLVIGDRPRARLGPPGHHQETPLYVLGGVLLGGIVGEAIGIERRLEGLGDRIQARLAGATSTRTVSEGFVTASLLFCVGPLTVVGSIQDGLTGDYDALATKAVLDGFASIALAASLGWGVGLAALTVLVVQGAITLGAGLFDDVLAGEALAALTSAGGMLDHRDRAQAARHQGRQGRQLPPGARDRPPALGRSLGSRSSTLAGRRGRLRASLSAAKPGVRIELDRLKRRRLGDVEAHAVALLDRRDRGAPGGARRAPR